jgi:uncharacterized membrane protein
MVQLGHLKKVVVVFLCLAGLAAGDGAGRSRCTG